MALSAIPTTGGFDTTSRVSQGKAVSSFPPAVEVTVRARYAPERSNPSKNLWFFLYTINIKNCSSETVQLLSRRWIITDARGGTEEVKGPGVVGKQPKIAPDQAFEYTSGCPLNTPFGSMHGWYQMVNQNGGEFEVAIPGFALRDPKNMQ